MQTRIIVSLALATVVTSAAHVIETVGGIGIDLAPPPDRPSSPRDGLSDVASRVLDACPVRIGVSPERLATIVNGDCACTTHVPLDTPTILRRTARAEATPSKQGAST